MSDPIVPPAPAPTAPAASAKPPTPVESKARQFFEGLKNRIEAVVAKLETKYGTEEERAAALAEILAIVQEANTIIGVIDPAAAGVGAAFIAALQVVQKANAVS
jgi:hypothetical protein